MGYNREPTPYIKSVDDPGIEITVEENKTGRRFSLDAVSKAVQEVTGNPLKYQHSRNSRKRPSGRATKIKIGDVVVWSWPSSG